MRRAAPVPVGLQVELDAYDAAHPHPVNRALQAIGVPLLAWSILALLWTIPVPRLWFRPGAWGVLAIVLAFYWYWKRSRTLASALLLTSAAFGLLANALYATLGARQLLEVGAVALVAASLLLATGARFESHPPAWRVHPAHLLVAAAWVMARLLHRLGIRFTA